MPRRKVSKGLIANRRVRASTFARRAEGLKKKARELATLCGVPVALVCADGEGGAADVWESEEGVIARYRALPAEERARHTHRQYAEDGLGKEEAKLARVRQGGPAALVPWDKALDGVTLEEAEGLLGSVDAALRAANDRRRALGLPVDDNGAGLLEGIAPLGRGSPPCVESNFVGVDGYVHAPGNGGEQIMWDNGFQPCRTGASMMQPAGYGFQQCTSNMDDYHLQRMPDMYGTNRLVWDAFQPRDAGMTQPGYGFQSTGSTYVGMPGYQTQQLRSVQPNLAMWSTNEPSNAIVPAGYPSFDIGLSYMDSPAKHAGQGIGGCYLSMGASGNFINAAPAQSLSMGTGDNFTNTATAQPLATSYGDNLMNASGCTTHWPAPQLQRAGTSQQSSLEQLHYLSDLEDAQLQPWGN
ncbi:uncharacterized protein LOC133911692 [Phragmites australis]|uniref:uncharacterized protein LOC133911692 n=1 Tax=Phragmites australis TaxID=29695 RepID=UPI002D77EDD8|nr:uncharacterized protein LOC133911692 [Phragmites australis]